MKLTLEIPDRVYKILKDFLLEENGKADDLPFEKILEEAGMEENLLEDELDFDK